MLRHFLRPQRPVAVVFAARLAISACHSRPRRPWLPPLPAPGQMRDRRVVDATAALPAVGERVPAFQSRVLESPVVFRSAELRGAPAVVALWATYCYGSRLAARDFEALRARYARRGVRFVLLAVNDDPTRLRAFVDSARVASVVVPVDSTQVWWFDRSGPVADTARYRRLFSLPSFVVVDRTGRIAARSGGGLGTEHLSQALDSLLAR